MPRSTGTVAAIVAAIVAAGGQVGTGSEPGSVEGTSMRETVGPSAGLEHRHGSSHELSVQGPVPVHHDGDEVGNHNAWFLASWSWGLQRSGRSFALDEGDVRGPDPAVTVLDAPVGAVHALVEVAQHHALRVRVLSVADRRGEAVGAAG